MSEKSIEGHNDQEKTAVDGQKAKDMKEPAPLNNKYSQQPEGSQPVDQMKTGGETEK